MATLPSGDIQRIASGLSRWWSKLNEETPGISSGDLYDAVVATDQWIDDNQASYNNALPEAVRINFTAQQKILLFCGVALMRFNVDILRKVFGEVN